MSEVKDKEGILKVAREKQVVSHKGTPIRLSVDFSAETLQARREWHDTVKVLKEKTANQEYSTQQSCPSEWKEIKSFPYKQKLKEFITTVSALKEMLKVLLQDETRVLISNRKTYESINLIGKDKYRVNSEYSNAVMVVSKSLKSESSKNN